MQTLFRVFRVAIFGFLMIGLGRAALAQNTAPTIGDIPDQIINEDTATPTISFFVNDAETLATSLNVTASSSNPALAPPSNIILAGSGTARTIQITPTANQFGIAMITVTVNDGATTASTANDIFQLTVNSVNDLPTISNIPDQTTVENTATSAIAFRVGDVETAPQSLIVFGLSENTTVVPHSGISVGGSGADRTVTVTPTNQTGSATIRIIVQDETGAQTSDTFLVTVTAGANTPPTISNIPDQGTNVGTPTAAIPFSISDTQTPLANLALSAASSNTSLVPLSNIVFGGSDSSRTIVINPAANQAGTATITVFVSDGLLTASQSFNLTVGQVGNTPPTISDIPNQTTAVNTTTSLIGFMVNDAETAAGSLIVSGSSSNPTVVSNQNIAFGGSGSNRSVIMSPAANQSGIATITITVTDGAGLSSSDGFVLTVGQPSNTPPTISDIPNQATALNTSTPSISFTINDNETAAGSLIVSGSSSDPSLVPDGNIAFGGSVNNRTLIITPAANQSGTVSITIIVTDGSLSATDSFTLTVGQAANTPPTISDIGNQTTAVSTPTQTIPFTIGDAQTAAANLIVTGSSSNPALVPDSNILFSGADAARSVIIFPASGASGTATITITVSDGILTASDSFVLTVGQGGANTPPTISDIPNQTINENSSTGAINFTVNDLESPATSLTLSANSSNPALVSSATIAFAGSGAGRTIIVTPEPNRSGTAIITITVSDGTLSASDSFTVTVVPVQPSLMISDIPDQTMNANSTSSPINFTIGDVETPAANLIVSGTSANKLLVPDANLQFGGSGANRSLIITPAPSQSGTCLITVTVSDGTNTAFDTFLVTVVAPGNTAPTISDIPNQSTAVGTPTRMISFTIGDVETTTDNLQVIGFSSNTSLVPDAGISLGGSGASRAVIVAPRAGQSGSTVITIRVSDGIATATDTFTLTVSEFANTAPTISDIGNQTTPAGTPTQPISFTIGDAQTAPVNLNLIAASSNQALVPLGNIQFSGGDATRLLIITPAAGVFGTALITVTVSDGSLSTSDSFSLTVTPGGGNTPPTISNTPDQTVGVGATLGPLAFTVGDLETAAANLTLTASSSNPSLVPVGNVLFSGTDASRSLVIFPTPGLSGTTTISVTVSDGALAASDSFVLTVGEGGGGANTPPTISDIPNQTTLQNSPTPAIPFSIGDLQTAPGNLILSATSSDPAKVPNQNIVISGTGSSRSLVITPAANATGTLTITITVSDGSLTATDSFTLTISPGQTLLTISDIADQTTAPGTSISVPFTIGSLSAPLDSLLLTAGSSNPTLVPVERILFGGTGANRTALIIPEPGRSGTSIITISVRDQQGLVASDSFTLTVGEGGGVPNTPPTISDIPDQTTGPGGTIGPIAFTIGDAETAAANLRLSLSTSNPNLVPLENITLGGQDATRSVLIFPAAGQLGSATITITVNDGTLTTNDTFVVTVGVANDPPTISNIGNQTTGIGMAVGPISFTVGDVETAATNLVVTGDSSNPILVPITSILFSGNDANRSVVIFPAAGQSGTATITITVSDGSATASDTFVLTVAQAFNPPTITTQPRRQSVLPGGSVTFSVTATGTAPLTYQWLFNGATIGGATNSSLPLNNVQAANAGNFTVVVSNPAGIAISDAALLTLREGLKLAAPRILSGGLIQLSITGQPGETYAVQVSTDLRSWTTAATLVNMSGTATFIDPDSATRPLRFYRAILQP